MKLDLSEIVTHLGKRIKYEIDEPPIEDFDSGIRCVAPVKGEVTFTNSGSHIVVRGHFDTAVEVECARCLEPDRMDLNLPIEEEFQISGRLPEATEVEEDELPEDAMEPLFVDNVLDLTELLRQDIVVAVPIKPLCDEACKGLCPRCGKNLNQGPCECPPEEANTAFADLAALLEEEESKS